VNFEPEKPPVLEPTFLACKMHDPGEHCLYLEKLRRDDPERMIAPVTRKIAASPQPVSFIQ